MATLTGRMSIFGGPQDRGVSANEGLALCGPKEMHRFPEGLFLPQQPPGTTGLARRLDPQSHYIAMRWDYEATPRRWLRNAKVTVINPANGRQATAQPIDWGPHERTGRICDISPGLATALGLETDDMCSVEISAPQESAMATPKRRVLDISHHNTVNDLDAVKAAGIWGIIHKATEGTGYVDDKYAGRKKGFLEIGLLWGAYHFAHPGNVSAQVDHFLKTAGVDDATLYALDWEASSSGTMDEDDAVEFCELLEKKTGRKGIIYSGNSAKEEISGANEYLGAHRLWLAQYGSSPTPQQSWNNWWLWQYSDGEIGPSPHGCPGVSGFVDTNSWEKDEATLRAEWSGTGKAIVRPPAVARQDKIVQVRIYQPPGVQVEVTIDKGEVS